MPFTIVRNDIANMQVDAIVNTTNPRPAVGYGSDTGVHLKAGPQLLEARKTLGTIRVGDAGITPGFRLPARFVIHTVGPVWQGGGKGEVRLLRSCYERSLHLARRQGLESIAFPLISAGNHGFPKEVALQTAMDTIRAFLLKYEMQVYLVVFSRDAFRLSETRFRGVASFIDEHYVAQANRLQYGVPDKCSVRELQQRRILEAQQRRQWDLEETTLFQETAPLVEEPEEYRCAAPMPDAPEPPASNRKKGFSLPFPRPKATLADLLAQTDAGFSETLLKLIDETGKKDSAIYKKANISKQHFSKIKNNPHYSPSKATAIAFAIALELDLEQTRDLIGRAGYALTTSSKFDLIVMYFIQQKNYNLFDINAALFEFDQSLLGA